MKQFIFLLVVSLVFFSCKKKDPPLPTTESPVFKFRGTINGDSVNYIAGNEHMFMYTGFYLDSQNLVSIKSYLAPDNCTNCEPYLSFEVKDFDVSSSGGLAGTIYDILQTSGGVLNSYSLDSVFTVTSVERFTFLPVQNNPAGAYLWDFGDGGTSNLASPSYVFSTGGLKNVKLKRTYGGSTDTIVNQINTDFFSPCRVQFTTLMDTFMNGVYVQATPSGFQYDWNFGDGNTGTGITDSNFYVLGSNYNIKLTATTSSCTAIFNQHVNFTGGANASFNYATVDTTISGLAPRLNKSAFIITWIKNGVVYKSYKNLHGINQSGNPVFTFTGVLPYKPNANGDPTVLVTGNVDTYLYNEANAQDSIKIKSSEIVLSAAYPNK